MHVHACMHSCRQPYAPMDASPRLPEQSFYVNPGSTVAKEMMERVNSKLLTSYKAKHLLKSHARLLLISFCMCSSTVFGQLTLPVSSVVETSPVASADCIGSEQYTNPGFALCCIPRAVPKVWRVVPTLHFRECDRTIARAVSTLPGDCLVEW